jgi:hypothetical protein
MFKQIALGAGLAVLLAGPVMAQQAQTPSTPDDCLQAAFELAQAAEEKKLPDEKLDRIEELLTKMETHCDAKQFNEAMAVADDIRSVIDGQ